MMHSEYEVDLKHKRIKIKSVSKSDFRNILDFGNNNQMAYYLTEATKLNTQKTGIAKWQWTTLHAKIHSKDCH